MSNVKKTPFLTFANGNALKEIFNFGNAAAVAVPLCVHSTKNGPLNIFYALAKSGRFFGRDS